MRRGLFIPVAILLLTVALSLQACKKKHFNKEKVTIINNTGIPAIFEIYSNEQDYANGTNAIISNHVPANETYEIDGSKFADGVTYYFDWYSDNYYYNNWYNDNYPLNGQAVVRINPSTDGKRYYMNPEQKGFSRLAFLKGNDVKTNWIAVDAYLYSTTTGYISQWSNLAQYERFRTITVKKNFKADYNHRNSDGSTITETLEFIVHKTETPYIEFMNMQGLTAGNMTAGELPTSTQPDYKSSSIDTVMALFPDSDVYFMMVRQ